MDIFGLTPEHLLGKPTIHVGMNLIVQKMSENKVVGVFQCSEGVPLLMNSNKTHQLIMGDVFVRPMMVVESDSFIGSGLNNLAMSGFVDPDRWLENGRVIFRRS